MSATDQQEPAKRAAAQALPVSERPFGISGSSLKKNRERAPLIHVFKHAVMEQKTLRGRLQRIARLQLRAYAAECGVYQGHSLAACLEMANHLKFRMTIVGLDTFKGLPDLSATDKSLAPSDAPYKDRQFFTATSVESVAQLLNPKAGICRYELVPGLFSETLPNLPERRYFFVNIDCDLFEPHLECLNYFYPRLVRGGILFFDDYHSMHYPMGKKAIDEFFSGKREKIWHLRLGEDGPNLTKTFIIKE
jgi:hypothetical protein